MAVVETVDLDLDVSKWRHGHVEIRQRSGVQ